MGRRTGSVGWIPVLRWSAGEPGGSTDPAVRMTLIESREPETETRNPALGRAGSPQRRGGARAPGGGGAFAPKPPVSAKLVDQSVRQLHTVLNTAQPRVRHGCRSRPAPASYNAEG